jgi:hypothetical protein
MVGLMKPNGRIQCVIARLRELVAALDRRTPRLERPNENQIAGESAALREHALERIAEREMHRQS